MNLSESTEAYQALLEGHRAHPDDEVIEEELLMAKAEMESKWLAHTFAKSLDG